MRERRRWWRIALAHKLARVVWRLGLKRQAGELQDWALRESYDLLHPRQG